MNLVFEYSYEQDLPLDPLFQFLITILLLFSIFGILIYGLYYFHNKGVIEVYIPKPFRIYCFKNYLSKNEKEEEKKKKKKAKQTEL